MTPQELALVGRITEALDYAGLSWYALALAVGKSVQASTKWKKGKVSKDTLADIARVTKVNSGWLLDGKGAMLNFDNSAVQVHSWDSDTPLETDEIEIPFYKDFLVACGAGSFGSDFMRTNEWRRLRLSKSTLRNKGVEFENVFAMTAFGDSMRPTITDHATVFIDIGKKTIKDGRIFAIEHGGMFKFKRLYALPMGGVRIVSDNTDEYPEERLSAQEVREQEFKIIGWAFLWQAGENW